MSSSSFILPLLNLSYCQHQQTTYYSPNGFTILHSAPRFLSARSSDKKHLSSFYEHNAVHSGADQMSSTTISLMLSSLLSNGNSLVIDQNENNMISTTINPLTKSTFSSITLLHTSLSTIEQGTKPLNMILLIGCIMVGIIILTVVYILVKYYLSRNEGSYKIDESKNFVSKSHSNNNDNSSCAGKISITNHNQNLLATNEQNINASKEWYV